jgi:hypothetical protein
MTLEQAEQVVRDVDAVADMRGRISRTQKDTYREALFVLFRAQQVHDCGHECVACLGKVLLEDEDESERWGDA